METLAIGLTACGRSGAGEMASGGGDAATIKLNAYTRAHDTLLGGAGLRVAENVQYDKLRQDDDHV